MTDTAAEKRAANRALWRARGTAWIDAVAKGASAADETNQAMIAAAAMATGQTVLDVGAGTGEPAISIALHVGETGRVVACDIAAEMLAGTRRRAAALALGNVSCTVADMECLPFGDAGFDALTCRFGLMFTTDRDGAAAEARRVLKPGARAVYTVWGPVEDNTVYLVSEPLVKAYFGLPDPDTPSRRHSLGAPGTVAGILEHAGFTQVEERAIAEVARLPVGQRFWHSRLQRNFADRYAALSEADVAALDEKIAAAFEPYRDGDKYVIRSHARFCVATAP
jgi:SAM-dependent methyltransferase